ncbi:transketolase family protein [Neorickettsia sennetsu]|uniref:transketolase n=1 Tax=Ehrlichia sennetsu (strain ATCC VR-367 / Miyayama) TaxID=222891 RepID=Q2GD66_EHRS3|nr:transketolase [Neorickettsia sennetsu]ABD45940.1 transketolase, insertion [Neorickettsia sennetsu str. Miyayama]
MRRMSAAIRVLTIDAVSRANSGHPGMPLGMADVATVLFAKFLKFCPNHPDWPDRDRFVLSAGHGSMLLYSLLYLTGYPDYTIEELKNFRQLHSKTPGHPEYGIAKGIENTSGPLGQGLATGIGMALAEATLNSRFGNIIDHYTYIIAGDGCLMEGISHEAASFAGHMKLRKIILFFDDNGISIDGSTSLCLSDNNLKRFESYGWDVQQIDGHDFAAIENAIANARSSDRPSLIAAKTVIGKSMPKEGTSKTHSGGLTREEVIAFRKRLEYPLEEFSIPEDVLRKWRSLGSLERYKEWQLAYNNLPGEVSLALGRTGADHNTDFLLSSSKASTKTHSTPTNEEDYIPASGTPYLEGMGNSNGQPQKQNNVSGVCNSPELLIPRDKQELCHTTTSDSNIGKLNSENSMQDLCIEPQKYHPLKYTEIFNELRNHTQDVSSEATRQSSGRVVKFLTSKIPEMLGGSCDLTGSNNVVPEPFKPISASNYNGNYIHYGVREHFMGACMNGMALHGNLVPYGGTFLIFSDYMRPSIRMSALMGLQTIYVMTHDSIGVGEDGPTHQPVEQLDSLNLIPNLYVFRPCDHIEVAESWQAALSITNAPSVIVLSRQKVNYLQREFPKENMCCKGAYLIKKASKKAKVSLLASGSEVSICAEVQSALEKLGYPTDLVSVPCISILKRNSTNQNRKQLIEPESIPFVVEASSGLMISSMFGVDSESLFNITEFGISAPYDKVYNHFGLTVAAVLERCLDKLSKSE